MFKKGQRCRLTYVGEGCKYLNRRVIIVSKVLFKDLYWIKLESGETWNFNENLEYRRNKKEVRCHGDYLIPIEKKIIKPYPIVEFMKQGVKK